VFTFFLNVAHNSVAFKTKCGVPAQWSKRALTKCNLASSSPSEHRCLLLSGRVRWLTLLPKYSLRILKFSADGGTACLVVDMAYH
jgi:hypothetical protein